jgi:hypothetical protein
VAATACPIGKPILENKEGKINMLLQSVISGVHFNSFTLISDQGFVKQSAGRIVRALFEIVCARNWTAMSLMMLQVCLSFISASSDLRLRLTHLRLNFRLNVTTCADVQAG